MKRCLLPLYLFFSISLWAQTGYEIKITLKPVKNQYVYLGHYLGKQLPIVDSVKLNDKSEGIFKGAKKLGGGIYLIGYPDRSHNFEILIDKNQHFSILADTNKIREVSFLNSPDNTGFKTYQKFMDENGRAIDSLTRLRSRSTPADSIKINGLITALDTKITAFRNNIISKEPNSLMSVLLKAMKEPEIPQNDPAAKTDSQFAYHYYKKHYWDGVNFYDDRLARTPFLDNRIDKYFDQLVYPASDSVIKEIDWMLGFASISEEMQKFLLLKFVNRYLNQKYMWDDAVFVHLFEKYFSQKTYSWLTPAGQKIITDRAYSLMANLTGSVAADIELPDSSGNRISLFDVKSDFTVVCFWDPTCSHCKEVVPKLDSFYRAKWKAEGVTLFAVARETDGKRSDWTNFLNEHHLWDWKQVYYSKQEDNNRITAGIPGYSQLYDVLTFPTLYLLDKDKRIIAKKLTYQQIDDILDLKLKTQQ
jgi:thiol-disulfide isomerase/thioredoxin